MGRHERRRWQRLRLDPAEVWRAAWIRPGGRLRLVDVSVGGTGAEVDGWLRPAARVAVSFRGGDSPSVTRGRVVHVRVARVAAHHVTYLVGIAFDQAEGAALAWVAGSRRDAATNRRG